MALVLAVRRGLTKPDVLALAFTLPPLIVVTAQAFIAGANANWAAAAYTPGAVLVAGLLVRWKARPWIIAAAEWIFCGFASAVATQVFRSWFPIPGEIN